MEIPEAEFHKALVGYFLKLYKRTKKTEFRYKEIVEVIEALQKIVAMDRLLPKVKESKVHLGHVFGPFGFKVK